MRIERRTCKPEQRARLLHGECAAVWWKPSHPFVRHVRHTEALSTLPISSPRNPSGSSPGSRWAFLLLSIMPTTSDRWSIADERRWLMLLIQIEVNRNHERSQRQTPKEGWDG